VVTDSKISSTVTYRRHGYCPICEGEVEFVATTPWYRESLSCLGCRSVPRERALALVLSRRFPHWREMAIHESSPARRGISPKIAKECRSYTPTQFFPNEALGVVIRGFRNENLERQTFKAQQFDLVVTLDVMEHVNRPAYVFHEIMRTLKPGGAYIFTVPTYKGKVNTERRALYNENGEVEHLAKPEYHGNPVDDAGSLVTFHYGYDLPEFIHKWCGADVEVLRFHDHHHGIIGDFTEVYVATREGENRKELDSNNK
jgi:SAM-dependent methyltransferase